MATNPTDDLTAPSFGKARLDPTHTKWVIRLPVFFTVLLAAYIAAQFGRAWVLRYAPPSGKDWVSLATSLLIAAILVGIYVRLVRSLERRAVRELAPGVIQAVAGIALGLALFSSVFGLLRVIGVAHWLSFSGHFDIIPMLSVSILAAVGEELAFRASLFRILEERLGTAAALALSAALFGLLHTLNPGATIVSTTAIALEAGVLLAAAYVLTRNLWFPIGLHLGWNLTEGGVFGVSVSGGSAPQGVFSVSLAGHELLTGGKFGPEASLVAIAVCLALAIVLLALAVRRGRCLPMPRRAARAAA